MWLLVLCFVANMRITSLFVCIEAEMRTNIVIDDDLMADAIKATGLGTKKEVVEQGLKLIIKLDQQQAIRELRGKLQWEGDLEEMRGAE